MHFYESSVISCASYDMNEEFSLNGFHRSLEDPADSTHSSIPVVKKESYILFQMSLLPACTLQMWITKKKPE